MVTLRQDWTVQKLKSPTGFLTYCTRLISQFKPSFPSLTHYPRKQYSLSSYKHRENMQLIRSYFILLFYFPVSWVWDYFQKQASLSFKFLPWERGKTRVLGKADSRAWDSLTGTWMTFVLRSRNSKFSYIQVLGLYYCHLEGSLRLQLATFVQKLCNPGKTGSKEVFIQTLGIDSASIWKLLLEATA